MRAFILLLSLTIIAILAAVGCKESNAQNNILPIGQDQSSPVSWTSFINDATISPSALYYKDAVCIDSKGAVYDSDLEKAQYFSTLRKDHGKATDIGSIFQVKIKDTISYKILASKNNKGDIYKHFIIERGDGEIQKLRELELIVKSTKGTTYDKNGIDQARSKWIQLCNEHNPDNLVSTVYTTNAIYYNHKPVVIGTTDISKEYAYMSRERYNLLLTPIHVEPVNQNIVYEIGQCSGSYGGKYMIVWSKEEDQNWKVLMDSNL